MIPTSKLLELKELSEKATQGPWLKVEYITVNGICLDLERHRETRIGSIKKIEDASFIRTANPTVIKAMVEELIAAREVIGYYADNEGTTYHDQITAYNDWVTAIDDNDVIEISKGFSSGGKRAREHQSKFNSEEGNK